MSIARAVLTFSLSAVAVSACAYAPEATEPRWTDTQLQSAPPSQAPQYVPAERIGPTTFVGFDAYQRILARQRDEVQAQAGEIPDGDGQAENYAAEARERATPPEPQ